MRNLNEYDFSKSSGFKDALLKKCLTKLAASPEEQISDEDLELVAAAGTNGADMVCPVWRRPCRNCIYGMPSHGKVCSLGYHK